MTPLDGLDVTRGPSGELDVRDPHAKPVAFPGSACQASCTRVHFRGTIGRTCWYKSPALLLAKVRVAGSSPVVRSTSVQ